MDNSNTPFDNPDFMQFFTAMKQRTPFIPIEHIVNEFNRHNKELIQPEPTKQPTTKTKSKTKK